jgi:hypothetical protein
MNPNRKYLFLNLFFIGIEIALVILSKMEILALNYGWEGRMNRYVLIFIIGTQLLFHFWIFRLKDIDNQKRLYLGQLVLFACVAVWIGMNIEVHYKLTM